MPHIHICLVSDHTIPNVLSISHFEPDEILFISTDSMERKNKVNDCIQALLFVNKDYRSKSKTIVVKEDSLLDCEQKLDDWIRNYENAEFSINITGGTKIMSIATYEFFKNYDAIIGYIPINKNDFIIVFPKNNHNIQSINLKLSVKSYLAACGVKIINDKKLSMQHEEAVQRAEISKWIVQNYEQLKSLLERFSEKLRQYRNERNGNTWQTTYVPQNEQEKELLNKVGFKHENDSYTKHLTQSEIIYLTGGWLEEFCYTELIKFQERGIDDVVMGIIAEKGNAQNEFDVMFTKDNALYTVECKSLEQNDDKKAEALYKIGALQKNFGLTVKSFFVSTSPHIIKNGELKNSIKYRAEQFKTKVIQPNEVVNFADIVIKEI